MDQINEKLDKIIFIFESLVIDIQKTKMNTTKMSDHIDTVDYYARLFDNKFRPERAQILCADAL